jgi:hypothetical protein
LFRLSGSARVELRIVVEEDMDSVPAALTLH